MNNENNNDDEDDKPTVVLNIEDLKALQENKQDSLDTSSIDLEFNVFQNDEADEADEINETAEVNKEEVVVQNEKDHVENNENNENNENAPVAPVVLFDYQSDLFEQSLHELPQQHNYTLTNELKELNQLLQGQEFKIVFFNYNANPKAVNQLTAQIRKKFPHIKTVIVAKNLSEQKVLAHSKSLSGADGYISLPLDKMKVNEQVIKLLK